MRSIFHTRSVFHIPKEYFTHSAGMNFIKKDRTPKRCPAFLVAGVGLEPIRAKALPLLALLRSDVCAYAQVMLCLWHNDAAHAVRSDVMCFFKHIDTKRQDTERCPAFCGCGGRTRAYSRKGFAFACTLAVPKICFGLERRQILTAAPFPPRFSSHCERFGGNSPETRRS